jgi:hypothetical protein
MKAQIAALGLASVLIAPAAWASTDAGDMTIKEFRLRPEQAQVYMVLGAAALTSKLGVSCPQPIAVGEWRAALVHRTLDVTRSWVEVLMELMDERGCAGQKAKGDA